jgi:O-antigen ligase
MKDLNALLRHPALLVWCLYVAATPFYVAPNGLPQPGDALIFLLVPATLFGWNGRLHRTLSRPIKPLLWFIAWVFVVNYGWALILWKWGNFKDYVAYPIFYSFNAMVFFCALVIYQRFGDLFLRLTTLTVFATVIFQVVASFFFSSKHGFRDSLFFNTPNQLGYYALLAACILVLTQRRLNFGLLKAACGVTGCAYLAMLSTSRAALAGIAILMFLLLFSNPKLIIAASLAAIALTTVGGPVARAIDDAQRRGIESRDSGFAEERGYDRLWKFKEHLLLGAGEGDHRRFDTRTDAREIHSSAAGVLFSYGVVGAVLFVLFVVRLVRGSALRLSIMLIPTLVYTIAHQGLRFTMLWVLLATFVALKLPAVVKAARTPRGRALDIPVPERQPSAI